ncbi:MAG TPA: hypothetical protein VHE83_13310 [Mycobacteriales bacterium]|nr:hypothetical protein [Mycobacteriales bacterium]
MTVLWSAGSLAVPPADLFAETGGPALRVTEAGPQWVAGDVAAPLHLAPRLLVGGPGRADHAEVLERLATLEGRRAVQVADGLAGEVLHPDPALLTALAASSDVLASARAFNAWIAAFADSSEGAVAGVGIIPATGLDDALRVLAECHQAGLRGVTLTHPPAGPGTAPGGEALAFWTLAAEQGTVVCVNAAFGGAPLVDGPVVAPGRPAAVAGFLPRLAFAGVLDQVAGLRLLCVNLEAGWLPYVLESTDTNYLRTAGTRTFQLPDPDALPSEYLRRVLWCTFSEDRFAVLHRAFFGEHHLLWSGALPSDVSSWPDDEQAGHRMCAGLDDAAVARLLGDTCRRLFRLHGAAPLTGEEVEAFARPVLA